MGKTRSINLGTRSFSKAGDARSFFSSMLQRYGIGERVSEIDAADLASLMNRHDEKADKIGCGVAYFSVNPAPEYPDQRCFWITRTDGSQIDISYQHCLEKKPYD